MSNALAIIRSLIIYSLCLPLAIFVGYLLAMPMDSSSVASWRGVGAAVVPVILRWHHPFLVASWNLSLVMFFPARRTAPVDCHVRVSLLLSVLHHIFESGSEARVRTVGGAPFDFFAPGDPGHGQVDRRYRHADARGDAYGGRRYIVWWRRSSGISRCPASASRPAATTYTWRCSFLPGLSAAVGNLAELVGPQFYFIFAFFPADSLRSFTPDFSPDGAFTVWRIFRGGGRGGLVRIGAARSARLVPHERTLAFSAVPDPRRFSSQPALAHLDHVGGHLDQFAGWVPRGGHHFCADISLPVLSRRPASEPRLADRCPARDFWPWRSVCHFCQAATRDPTDVQFLPVEIDPVVRMSAEATVEWRLRMWRTVAPTVPQYLVLGKGYSINPSELAMAQGPTMGDGSEASMVAGDYHSGPLTLLIPLGIWGALGFLWFLGAAVRLFYRNYRYGDPELRLINTFLFSYFVVHIFSFFTIFGSFHHEFFSFTGLAALSICLNGGMRGPASVPVEKPAFNQFKLARATR